MYFLGLMLICFIFGAAVFPPWSGEEAVRKLRRYARRGWIYPEFWLTAVSRCYPVMLVGMLVGALGLFCKKVAVQLSPTGSIPPWAAGAARVGAWVFAATMFLSFLIILINQPSFLVPRGLREEEGLLQLAGRGLWEWGRRVWRK